MPTAQPHLPQRPRSAAAAKPHPDPRGSRFAQAARDPRWNAQQSAAARDLLARKAALARRQLAERRAAAAASSETPPLRPRRVHRRRNRAAAWLVTLLLALVTVAVLGSAPPVSSQTRQEVSRASVEEMHRLIEVAKEAGLTDEQIRQITIEDEYGNVVNAWDYLQELDKRKEMELARREAELNRVYLTPQDVFKELRERERADLDQLRDHLPFDRERYR